MTLEHQLKSYAEKLPELLPENEGRFALVYDGQVDVYDTAEEANAAGWERTGRPVGYLVVRITPTPSNLTG